MWRKNTAMHIGFLFKNTANRRGTNNRPIHRWLNFYHSITHIKYLHHRHIRTLMHVGPDTIAVRKYFALAKHRTAAGAVTHLLRTSLWAYKRGRTQYTLATAVAAEHALFAP